MTGHEGMDWRCVARRIFSAEPEPPDENIRAERKGLVQSIGSARSGVADLSEALGEQLDLFDRFERLDRLIRMRQPGRPQ